MSRLSALMSLIGHLMSSSCARMVLLIIIATQLPSSNYDPGDNQYLTAFSARLPDWSWCICCTYQLLLQGCLLRLFLVYKSCGWGHCRGLSREPVFWQIEDSVCVLAWKAAYPTVRQCSISFLVMASLCSGKIGSISYREIQYSISRLDVENQMSWYSGMIGSISHKYFFLVAYQASLCSGKLKTASVHIGSISYKSCLMVAYRLHLFSGMIGSIS